MLGYLALSEQDIRHKHVAVFNVFLLPVCKTPQGACDVSYRFLSGCSHTRKNLWLASQRAESTYILSRGFSLFFLSSANEVSAFSAISARNFSVIRVFRCYDYSMPFFGRKIGR